MKNISKCLFIGAILFLSKALLGMEDEVTMPRLVSDISVQSSEVNTDSALWKVPLLSLRESCVLALLKLDSGTIEDSLDVTSLPEELKWIVSSVIDFIEWVDMDDKPDLAENIKEVKVLFCKLIFSKPALVENFVKSCEDFFKSEKSSNPLNPSNIYILSESSDQKDVYKTMKFFLEILLSGTEDMLEGEIVHDSKRARIDNEEEKEREDKFKKYMNRAASNGCIHLVNLIMLADLDRIEHLRRWFSLAMSGGHLDLAQSIASRLDINAEDLDIILSWNTRNNMLKSNVYSNNVEGVKFLLELMKSVDFNYRALVNQAGGHLLDVAIDEHASYEMAEVLVEYGIVIIDPRFPDHFSANKIKYAQEVFEKATKALENYAFQDERRAAMELRQANLAKIVALLNKTLGE